jgi:peptidoglycan/xylan/chitin deacetylase (PgdA/CDA1 family)
MKFICIILFIVISFNYIPRSYNTKTKLDDIEAVANDKKIKKDEIKTVNNKQKVVIKKEQPEKKVEKKELVQKEPVKQEIEKEITTKIPIITFHRIVPDEIKEEYFKDNEWIGTTTRLEEMLKYISDNGYKTISADEFYDWYLGNTEYDQKTIMITIDDGRYDAYYYIYPLVKKYNLKVTFFVIGDTIEQTTPEYIPGKELSIGEDVIKKIRMEYPNFNFQNHSYGIHKIIDNDYKLNKMTKEEIELDFMMMNKYNFSYFAYPYGVRNDLIKEVLKEYNYKLAFTFGGYRYATREDSIYEIPRIKINGNADLDNLINWIEQKK